MIHSDSSSVDSLTWWSPGVHQHVCVTHSLILHKHIPHICHFLYTGRIFENRILHPKTTNDTENLWNPLKKVKYMQFFFAQSRKFTPDRSFYTGTDKYEVYTNILQVFMECLLQGLLQQCSLWKYFNEIISLGGISFTTLCKNISALHGESAIWELTPTWAPFLVFDLSGVFSSLWLAWHSNHKSNWDLTESSGIFQDPWRHHKIF